MEQNLEIDKASLEILDLWIPRIPQIPRFMETGNLWRSHGRDLLMGVNGPSCV